MEFWGVRLTWLDCNYWVWLPMAFIQSVWIMTLKALVDHSLACTCKRVLTFCRFAIFNIIFLLIIFLNFFLDRIQDLCIIFAIIVVFLVFFNTYIFQAGLVSLLIRKFKTTIIISILYLALSVGLHVWTMVSVP